MTGFTVPGLGYTLQAVWPSNFRTLYTSLCDSVLTTTTLFSVVYAYSNHPPCYTTIPVRGRGRERESEGEKERESALNSLGNVSFNSVDFQEKKGRVSKSFASKKKGGGVRWLMGNFRKFFLFLSE